MKNVTSDFLSYHYYSAKKPQNWDKMSVVSSCLVTNKKKEKKKKKIGMWLYDSLLHKKYLLIKLLL